MPLDDSDDKIQFGIWDTAGSERYKALAPMYYRGAEAAIVGELEDAQGVAMDIGGYYLPTPAKAAEAMRPSATLNRIIDGI